MNVREPSVTARVHHLCLRSRAQRTRSPWLVAVFAGISIANLLRADPPVRIDSDFPGGNIVCERIEGSDVYLHQDLRDTKGSWFYWYFRVRGAQGRELHFHFTNGGVLGPLGPAASKDGGATWQWLGHRDSATEFQYRFAPDAAELRFSFGMPYLEADLRRFLERYQATAFLKIDTLGATRKGTLVERLRLWLHQSRSRLSGSRHLPASCL